MSTPVLRRRTLLGAGLVVAFLPGCTLPVVPKRPSPEIDDAMGWVRHDGGGRFTLHLPRVEMGQDIGTALKQVACDELGVGWDRVTLRQHATDRIATVRATVGSESVKDFAVPLAQACAALREAVSPGAARTSTWVGRSVPAEDGRAIVTGQPLYAADVQHPGQCHGRVLRAPASPELPSRLLAADEAAARAVPGFVALVRDEALVLGNAEGLGIVARTPGALDRIEAALAPRWQVDGGFDAATVDAALDIDRRLAADGSRQHAVHDDRADGPWDVDLRVDLPFAAHAAIEPRAAVAEPRPGGGLQLWVGSQDVFYQRDVVAKRLGLAADQVVVQGCRVGGAFGGKTICTVELEAAVLARACGRPVKVQWTRAQEFRQAFHRPPSSHRLRVRLDGPRMAAWRHDFASAHILFTNAALPPWLQRVVSLRGDGGVARGAALPYRVPARRSGYDLVRLPVFSGPWRGLGAGPNGLAIEQAVDEAARRAGVDPLALRLDQAEDPRLARVLRAVADAARWGTPAPAGAGRRGRGLAAGIYKGSSYAAVVADVAVGDDGRARVLQLWCAHDCGRVVHPDRVRAQCEGNLVWGLGMVLVERLPLADGGVAAASFAESPIPRLRDVPPMQVVLVDEGEAPGGAGETAIVAAGAAIANALRDATGVRPARLPVTAEALRRA